MVMPGMDVNTSAGDSVSIGVWMNFEETIIGGLLDISFDETVLAFDDGILEPIGDPDFMGGPIIEPGLLAQGAIHKPP